MKKTFLCNNDDSQKKTFTICGGKSFERKKSRLTRRYLTESRGDLGNHEQSHEQREEGGDDRDRGTITPSSDFEFEFDQQAC